jgi:hypothetical protein
MSAIVNILVSLGLGSPISRAMVGAAIGFAYQSIIRPSISYYDENTPRPFILLMDGQNYEEGTYMPWWGWPVGGAVVFGMFI